FGGTVVVADGMGGRHGGVLASSTAVDEYLGRVAADDRRRSASDTSTSDISTTDTSAPGIPATSEGDRPSVTDRWRRRVAEVNDAVLLAGRAAGTEHLGTTLLAAHLDDETTTIVHVGDSRAYRF